MDEIDRKLLRLLQDDSSVSLAVLGDAVGLAPSSVNERIRKLRHRGVLVGWGATVEPTAVGLPVLAFLRVALDRPDQEAAFRSVILGEPGILECHRTTGTWTHLLKLRSASLSALDATVQRALLTAPGVSRLDCEVVLDSVKDIRSLPV